LQRVRRRLIDALAKLESDFLRERSSEHLARISLLVRRLALARFPRARVAALTGGEWLKFLDESGGRGQFSSGPGRLLASVPYQRSLPRDMDIGSFVAIVRDWVESNTRHLA
jgi:Ca-activated chloride channel family protein